MLKGLHINRIRNLPGRSKAYFALGLVCFFWGTTWIASRQGVRYMPALQLVGIRQLAGGFLYVLYFLSKGRVLPKGKEWKPILVLSFLNFMLANTFSTWGLQYIPGGLGSIIAATYPLWIVVIALVGKKAKLPLMALAGFFLGFAGICVIFSERLDHLFNPSFVFGILLSLVAAWAWAFGTIYTKQQARSFNPYYSLGLQMIISGVLVMMIADFSGISIPYSSIPYQSWIAIAYLIVFSSILTFVAFLYALQHLSPEQTSIYAYVNPIVAVVFSALFFDEKLTVLLAVGVSITLYGVYLINRSLTKLRQR